MYNPPANRVSSKEAAFDFIDQHPFATVISVKDGQPIVSHVPLTPQKVGSHIELVGHLARANRHWQLLGGDASVTVAFHGAHTYITPVWYERNDVPTWNYSAVHITGTVNLIESEEGILSCLATLTDHLERLWPSGWRMYVPEDLSGPNVLTSSIVGFRIKVGEVTMKRKLSQNRSATDRARVLKGLATREDEQSGMVLKDMQHIMNADGTLKVEKS
jgi:transcriptional regulator